MALATITVARDLQPEIMDQPGLDADLHRGALAALGRINWWSRTDTPLWNALSRLAATVSRPVRVLDVACGGGDVLQALAVRARRANLDFAWTGCDVSPVAIEYANRKASEAGLGEIRHVERDVLHGGLPECDAVICTLFLHHLTAPEAESLLAGMAAAARRLVLVDDLVRTRLGFTLAWCGARIITRSSVVHFDGPQSVRAAFSVDELHRMAERAGLARATIRRHWPQRMLLTWERPE